MAANVRAHRIYALDTVTSSGALVPLHVDTQVPEGLKSVCWTRAASDSSADDRYTLFGSGASQAIYAWSVTTPREMSAGHDEPEVCVTPISNGSSLVPSQGNIDGPRTMVMVTWSSHGCHAVVTASSDGKIRVRSSLQFAREEF